MGIMDFIKSELIEIIEWNDDSRDTLSCRWPDEDREIKRGAQLIVKESQVAQFMYLGQFGDNFLPGKHTLKTENIPVLSKLNGWKYGFESPFKADLYFVSTKTFTGIKWGTANPVMLRDKDFGVVRARAFGTYDFKIIDPKLFLREVAGTDNHFRVDEFSDVMRSRIVSVFSEALAESNIPVIEIATRFSEIGQALLQVINPVLASKYGLEMTLFTLENVSVPPEVEKAIDNRSSMAALGNLNDYVKFQMAHAIGKGEAGTAGLAAEIGMGLSMAQQMFGQGAFSQPSGTPSSPATPGIAKPLNVAEAAKTLGVSEQDVMAALKDGSLKGKKLGETYLITQQAIEEFLKS